MFTARVHVFWPLYSIKENQKLANLANDRLNWTSGQFRWPNLKQLKRTTSRGWAGRRGKLTGFAASACRIQYCKNNALLRLNTLKLAYICFSILLNDTIRLYSIYDTCKVVAQLRRRGQCNVNILQEDILCICKDWRTCGLVVLLGFFEVTSC